MRLLAVLSLLILSACARPDYIDPTAVQKNQDNTQQGADCPMKFTAANICAEINWTQGPQTPAESEFILKFWNAQTAKSTGPYMDPVQNFSVVLWMPSMGHGSSPVKIEKIENGIYRVRRVYFIMPGDWEVRMFLKDSVSNEQQTLKLVL